MKHFHLCLVLLGFFLASPGFTKEADVLTRLHELKLRNYAEYLAAHDPELVRKIGRRNDITIWAPGNDAVTRHHSHDKVARHESSDPAHIALHITTSGHYNLVPPRDTLQARSNDGGLFPEWPWVPTGTNFRVANSFLQDPEYTNLGRGRVARFVENYAAPNESIAVDTVAAVQITTGLGDITTTVRGPFKFRNGIIYETRDFFTLPKPFTQTMKHLNISQQFFNAVQRTQKLALFERSPAVTIFAPIDGKVDAPQINPDSYIVHVRGEDVYGPFFTPDLPIGYGLKTRSGATIKITQSDDTGETLVNGRRFVRPNVMIKNGVIHFIEGTL